MRHGKVSDRIEDTPHGIHVQSGRFGRLFPHLPALDTPDDALKALGRSMIEPEGSENDPTGDNKGVPAGFTYLGQFIDHDITFDTTPMPEVAIDPLQVHNFRTPALDLDSLYGLGPTAQPFLYQRAAPGKFLIGTCKESQDQQNATIPPIPNDLPRGAEQFALIGDPRNDENLLVAQTHVAMLKFHNKVIDTVEPDFVKARRIVTWHYQWIVLNDFLRRLIDPAVLDDVLQNGRKFYQFDSDAFIPVEFSIAAYRIGHTMVRHEYDHNRVFGPGDDRLFNANLTTLFSFTGLSGDGGRMPLPSNWAIDWRRFYALPKPKGQAVPFNLSRRLDPLLGKDLHALPGIPDPDLKRLSVRNLLRGKRAGLPSGQAVAAYLGVPALSAAEVASGVDGIDTQTPLWFYILKEADMRGEGVRMGPVGSRILAEVFVGLLQGDPTSFLSQAPGWTPTLASAKAGDFTMVDLLTFVDDINPIK